jgi:hypothetical protein
MIESLHVENFRCFKSLELHGLKRVNVVVGTNASGKTVLLEAIKLGLGATPPTISFLNQLRGFQPIYFPNPTPEQFRAYFTDLFHDFDGESSIVFSIVDSKRGNATVRIYFDPKHAVTTQVPQGQAQGAIGFQPAGGAPTNPPATTIIPLAFDRSGFSGEKSSLYATVQNGMVFLQPGAELGMVSGFFSSGYLSNPTENATWLSNLSVAKKSDKLKSVIRKHFPFVRDLSSESLLPGMAAVYIDIPSISRKLPATFVSWGINRVLTFLLAISTFKTGVVCSGGVQNHLRCFYFTLICQARFLIASGFSAVWLWK